MQSFSHETVLLKQTVESIHPHSEGQYIDCTVGGGGHTGEILKQSAPSGRVLGFDKDPVALQHVTETLHDYGTRLTLVHSDFRQIRQAAIDNGFAEVDGIVFDLGVSSPQFDVGDRGFSYRYDAPLDMRMNQTVGQTAAELIQTASEEELSQIFFEYGEERFSRAIARRIVRERENTAIATTGALAELVKEAIPVRYRRSGPHPARRVFQAIRIAVNDELGALAEGLDGAFDLLRIGGRLAVITFHSLEDRIVKQRFAEWSKGCVCPPDFPVCVCGREPLAATVTRKPVVASEEEVAVNPRARSAKLRIVERVRRESDGGGNIQGGNE